MWVGEGPSRQSRTERDGPVRSGKEMVRPWESVWKRKCGWAGWGGWAGNDGEGVGAWAGDDIVKRKVVALADTAVNAIPFKVGDECGASRALRRSRWVAKSVHARARARARGGQTGAVGCCVQLHR